jgi:hypothetical protein
MDHLPIVTTLDLPRKINLLKPTLDYKMVEWYGFRRRLFNELHDIFPTQQITNKAQLHRVITDLTSAIKNTMCEKVPKNLPCPHWKQWWNNDLREMKKEVSKLSNESFQYCALENHKSHKEYRSKQNKYAEEITKAKEQHWITYLEEANEDHLWTANKYLSEPIGDSGCS